MNSPTALQPSSTVPRSLRRNFYWTFVGNAVYAACQWGIATAIVKIGSVEKLGQFALGLAIAGPVFLFTDLSLRAVQSTDAKRDFAFGTYLGLRLVTVGIGLLAVVVLAIWSARAAEAAAVAMVVGFTKACESLGDVCYGFLQQNERMDVIAKSLLSKGLAGGLSLVAVLYFTKNLLLAVAAMGLIWLAVVCIYDVGQITTVSRGKGGLSLRPDWNLARLKRLVGLALPLGFVAMINSLTANLPRYFISRQLGDHALGIFAGLTYVTAAGTMVVAALGQSSSPRLASLYAKGDIALFCRLLWKLMAVGAGLGGVGLILAVNWGKPVLQVIYRPEYAGYAKLFVWLVFAAGIGFVGSFLGYAISAMRYFSKFAVPYTFVMLLTAFGCFLLIPRYGLTGAAWAVCISSALLTLVPLFIFKITDPRVLVGLQKAAVIRVASSRE